MWRSNLKRNFTSLYALQLRRYYVLLLDRRRISRTLQTKPRRKFIIQKRGEEKTKINSWNVNERNGTAQHHLRVMLREKRNKYTFKAIGLTDARSKAFASIFREMSAECWPVLCRDCDHVHALWSQPIETTTTITSTLNSKKREIKILSLLFLTILVFY